MTFSNSRIGAKATEKWPKITVWGPKKIAWVTKWGLLEGHLVYQSGLRMLFWPPKCHFRWTQNGKKNSKMLRPLLQTKYSPKTPHSESEFQTPRGTISTLQKGHWYIKEIESNFVNNQYFHVFHLQVCFLVVPCPSIPAPQTSETDYGDDYGDYDASVKVLKDLHNATFNDHTVGSW